MLNQQPFQHKFTSQIECDKEKFPKQAFNALLDFVNIQECHHLLWKMMKLSMCSDSLIMEGEETYQLFQFYEKLHEVVDAVFIMQRLDKTDSVVD